MGNIHSRRKNFHYRRLRTARTIRLLDLEPGAPEDPIKLTLRHVSLDKPPTYEALSYTWGDVSDTRQVLINGKPADITVSLLSALLQFRHTDPGEVRTLWADAVCINQADTTEKAAQVRMMDQIYSNARQVLVWLGPSVEGVDDLLKMLPEAWVLVKEAEEELEAQQTTMTATTTTPTTTSGDVVQKTAGQVYRKQNGQAQRRMIGFDWEPLFSIILRPWFSRKWVIQEFARARLITMCAGDKTLALPELGIVVRGLVNLPVNAALMTTWGAGRYRNALLNAYYLFATQSPDRWELTELVLATQWFDCADPRDQLFSLLSLADPDVVAHVPALRPDYTVDAAQVFTRWCVWELVERQRPDLLSITCEPAPGVPSWVANPTTVKGMSPLGMGRDYGFCAGGTGIEGEGSWFAVSPDNRILKCRGKKVDAISKLLYEVGEKAMPEPEVVPQISGLTSSLAIRQTTYREVQWIKDCERLAAEGDNEGRWTDLDGRLTPERYDMYWRTMLCDINLFSPSGRTDASMGPLFTEFFDQTAGLFSGRILDQYEDFVSLGMLIEPSLDKLASSRVFCTTTQGSLAQAVPWAIEGDEIWIIQGAKVPFIMRPTADGGGNHTLIGECYLHGVMDGEALDDGSDFVDLAIE